MHLIVYGDFNCPYSALASYRATWLETTRLATVEWRAVQHDTAIPDQGIAVVDNILGDLTHELDQVRGLLSPGEVFPVRLPPVRPNTHLASSRYAAAAADGRRASELRRRIFRAYWLAGADIADPLVLNDLQLPELPDEDLATTWQAAFDTIERPTTPSLVYPDGRISRGLGALQRLAELMPPAA